MVNELAELYDADKSQKIDLQWDHEEIEKVRRNAGE